MAAEAPARPRTLVTAPFLAERELDGRRWLVRLDAPARARRLVAATPLVRSLVERFALPRAADAAGEAAAAAVAALVEAGVLLDCDSLRIEPPSLELEITNRCNADCVMCPRADLRPLGDMDDATFARVLGVLERLPLGGVIVQGIGEPTLHRSLTTWAGALRERLGERPLVVVTNGFRLDPERLGELRSAGVDHVQWSFHSLRREVYDRIMGVRRFDAVVERLEACIRAHPDLLSLNVVVMDENAGELAALRAWAEGLGLPAGRVRPIPCFSRGGFVPSGELLAGAGGGGRGRCLYVARSLFVAWNGDLLPCSNDIAGEARWANLAEAEADALLRRWRDRILAPRPAFPMCARCDHHLRDTFDSGWFDAVRAIEPASPAAS